MDRSIYRNIPDAQAEAKHQPGLVLELVDVEQGEDHGEEEGGCVEKSLTCVTSSTGAAGEEQLHRERGREKEDAEDKVEEGECTNEVHEVNHL